MPRAVVLSERCPETVDSAWSVTAVSTVSEALDRLDTTAVDCLVCDHDPPAIEAVTAVARLDNESPPVPIVVATDQGSETLASDATIAGATCYVPCSPADWASLSEHLEQLLPADTPGAALNRADGSVLSSVFDRLPTGIVALDETGTVVDANATAIELVSEPPESFVGDSIGALAAEADRDLTAEYQELVDELVTTGAPRRSLVVRFGGESDRRWLRLTLTARSSDRGFSGTIGHLQEITEQKRQRNQLDRFETLIEAIPDPVYELDEAGQVTYWNQAALEEFGYDDVAFEDLDVSHFDIVPTDEIDKIQAQTRELLSGDNTDSRATITHRAIRADGRTFPAKNHFALRYDSDGRLRGAAGTIRDISHQKRRKQRLHVLNRVLRHNLGNDMNTIMGYAELLAERVEDPTLEGFADSIIRTAVGLASMAENVRRLQDVVEEGVAPEETTDVTERLDAAVEWIRESYPLADVSVDLFESPVLVHGTPKLRVAFQEVLENAVEHANRPQPAVSISTEATAEQVHVRIEDEGPGVPEHERAVLGGHEEITPLTHGSGLGLWTVKWIVEAAQGTVDIETGDDRGSTVTITLQRANRDT